MRNIHYKEIDSPIGPLLLCEEGGALIQIDFGSWADRMSSLHVWAQMIGLSGAAWTDRADHPLLLEAERQLGEYFRGERLAFALPLHLHGTPFQRSVWQTLAAIPYGEVCSYRTVAERIGNPKAVRAVGGANNKNPLPIVIPCHRVIGAGGSLVGYGGGLSVKSHLLDLERAIGGIAAPQMDVLS